MKLSVLMPVYNEARTLRTIVRRVFDAPVDAELEIVAVDDGSTDRSWEILEELAASDHRIVAVRQLANQGKGAAIRTAIEQMTGDIAVIQDSDLEYDPAEYPRLIKPIVDGRADAVFGSRFASSPERRVLFYWHSLGNKALTWLTNVLNDLNLTDMETCYKAVRADILKSLRLRSNRFGIEPEITTRLVQWGARIYEVPISYHGRTYQEGKNIGWRDGLHAIWLLFKYRFVDVRFSERHGHVTLENIGATPSVSRWLLEQIGGHLGDRVFEAGSGTGNITKLLLDKQRLVSVDVDPFCAESVDRQYGHLENVSVMVGDLEDAGLYRKLEGEDFDTVLCINVLEHLDHPELAVKGFLDLIDDQGRLVILVPAHSWLYSEVDRAIHHRQRFSEAGLRGLLEGAGLTRVEIVQFNRLGIVGWGVNKWLKRKSISRLQMYLFAAMLPIARLVERIRPIPGLSLIAVARR